MADWYGQSWQSTGAQWYPTAYEEPNGSSAEGEAYAVDPAFTGLEANGELDALVRVFAAIYRPEFH